MSFENGLDENAVNKWATMYLKTWGAWAARGDESRQLGYGQSTLSIPGAREVPVESLGEAVDGVIRVLPPLMVRLAVLLYQRRHPQRAVMREMRLSAATFHTHIHALKMAAWVGVEKNI